MRPSSETFHFAQIRPRPWADDARRRRLARHRCRALAVLTVISLAACSTTHDLGRLGDPETMARVDALAARPGTVAEVIPLPGQRPLPGPRQLSPSHPVTAAAPGGLMVSIGGAPPELLTYGQIRSLSTVDRWHGARNGALIMGVPSLVAGLFLGWALAGAANCSDQCTPSADPTVVSLKVGGLFALIGAAVGGAFGALAGYQDRYVVEAAVTTPAR